ncbi:hypothetical protein CKAN_02473600 [Cinnamomum micranthum f. kanehirae]|uniref:Transmembrane protein n=1 Tax=Cinnamomum micranthum f. kanehirae TaxID=337451 RepID=A0A443PX91_9MAGN|nr:hypothetical protein CKAN_02473600 [Cinnamomum micranthum f. kanehirae]
MMASAFAPPSPLLNFFLPPHPVSSPQTFKTSLPSSYHTIFSLKYPPNKIVFYPYSTQKNFSQKKTQSWRILAATGDVLPPNTPIEETQQIVPPDDSSGSTIISVLLLIAFVGLSILTIGVIYIAVTDFLQKREREKFEKEEAAKKKKSGKKGKVKARTGPRGFGQKVEDDDDD